MFSMLLVDFFKKNKALMFSILAISFPAIIEMGLNTLVGIFDTLMISHLIGKEALSASGYANQIVFTIIFIFSSFNVGATAMVSRSFGEKNFDKLNQAAGQNMTLNLVIGTVITVLTWMLGPMTLRIFDTTPEVYAMGRTYLNIVSYSQLFMFISFAAASALRGVENTVTPMIVTGIVNVLNIIGNYVLMTGFWFFPELGIAGAALSTTVSRFIGAVIYIVILFRGTNHLKLFVYNLKITKAILSPLWKLSSTAGIEQFLMQTSFMAMGIFISFLDTTSEASFRILLSIESASFMPSIGFSIAAATLVGKALGEDDQQKALHTGYIAGGLGVLWGIVIGLVFALFPANIISIFTGETDIIQRSVPAMVLAGFDQPLLAYIIIMSGALRGAGDTKTVMVLNALRLWGSFVPLTYVFITFAHTGVKSVWIAEIITLLVFNVIFYKRFQSQKWALIEI